MTETVTVTDGDGRRRAVTELMTETETDVVDKFRASFLGHLTV